MFLKNAISELLDCKEFSKPFAPPQPETTGFSLFQPKNPEILKEFIEITEDARPSAAVTEFNLINHKLGQPKPRKLYNKKYKIYESELPLNTTSDNLLSPKKQV